MFFLDFIDIHSIFFFLGLPEGDLVLKSVELILFVLITYMIISEYAKDQRRDLKYLVVAFGSLSFWKLVSTVVLTSVLFGRLGLTSYVSYFPVMDNALEVFALVLLSHAFLFPILREEYGTLKRNIKFQLSILVGVFLVLQIGLLVEILFYGVNRAPASNHLSSLLFTIMKLVLLLYAVFILSSRTDKFYPYRYSVIVAFLVYFVTPFIKLLNIAFYNNESVRLKVAGLPFPVIAVLLFTRVIFLKLVDKALLKRKLQSTEEKYKHEKELGELKDKFVSVVSHELRTPLTSISLYTSLFNSGQLGKINPKQKQALSVIKDESTRLTGLVNDILDLSKLEKKKILCIGELDLHEFIEKGMHHTLAEQKGIKIVNDVPKNFVLQVDPDKFKQVMINLISNAVKFTDKGSVTVDARKDKKNIIINVKDTGKGIPPEHMDKIFDRFFQAEHYMTRKQGGTGLGLTIANEIVRMHNGEIKVESELGKGSTFSIVLPKA